VGSTTLASGATTTLVVSMHMGRGMGGMHLFEFTVDSNDPGSTANKASVRANFIE